MSWPKDRPDWWKQFKMQRRKINRRERKMRGGQGATRLGRVERAKKLYLESQMYQMLREIDSVLRYQSAVSYRVPGKL